MKKPLLLLVNPVAGHGMFRNALGDIAQELYEGGYLPTVYFTQYSGHAREIAAKYGNQYDMLLCLGGDGTLSDVMGGLMENEKRPRLAYIPTGTANDVASSLGISRNPIKAARTALNGNPVPYDVGRFGDCGYFSYIAAFGAFTEISYETPQDVKQAFGHLAYLAQIMPKLPKLPSHRVHIEYDDGELDTELCFGSVNNSTRLGGVVKLDDIDGARVEVGDGVFEVLLVRPPAHIADMAIIASQIVARNYNNSNIMLLRSKRVRFTFEEPVAWTRDGEAGGMHQDLVLENIHAPLEIVTDAKA